MNCSCIGLSTFSYLGDDGNYTGFDIEIAQAACDQLGWEMNVFPVNWDQKLVQLDGKECDCIWSGMTILDSMKEAGYVISDPYYDNTQVLLVKKSFSRKPALSFLYHFQDCAFSGNSHF